MVVRASWILIYFVPLSVMEFMNGFVIALDRPVVSACSAVLLSVIRVIRHHSSQDLEIRMRLISCLNTTR